MHVGVAVHSCVCDHVVRGDTGHQLDEFYNTNLSNVKNMYRYLYNIIAWAEVSIAMGRRLWAEASMGRGLRYSKGGGGGGLRCGSGKTGSLVALPYQFNSIQFKILYCSV